MKKFVLLAITLLASLLIFTACGSNDLSTTNTEGEESDIDSYTIAGDWTYTGKDDNQNDIKINVDLEDDYDFSIEYLYTDKDSKESKEAFAYGTYTFEPDVDSVGEGNGEITLNFNEVTDEGSALFNTGVAVDSSETLPYLVSDEGVMLTLKDASALFKNMTEDINFARVD